MLSVRLGELVGPVERGVEPTTPVAVRHRPTGRGCQLCEARQPLVRYGETGPRLSRG